MQAHCIYRQQFKLAHIERKEWLNAMHRNTQVAKYAVNYIYLREHALKCLPTSSIHVQRSASEESVEVLYTYHHSHRCGFV